MKNDILIKAIRETAEEYVKDNVRVSVYESIRSECYSKYTLQLDYSNVHTLYKLHNKYCNQRTYIMRVVSDLCINLAKMTQRERNDFFKISNEEGKNEKELEFYKDLSEQLQRENKQLHEELEWAIGIVEHNRIIGEKNKEIHQLKDNWNKLKEHIKSEWTCFDNESVEVEVSIDILDKM